MSYLSDDAIEDIESDKLNRDLFAKRISSSIAEHLTMSNDDKRSFIFAIDGTWGSGKTSVINLIINSLKDQNKLKIIKFEPWLYSG